MKPPAPALIRCTFGSLDPDGDGDGNATEDGVGVVPEVSGLSSVVCGNGSTEDEAKFCADTLEKKGWLAASNTATLEVHGEAIASFAFQAIVHSRSNGRLGC